MIAESYNYGIIANPRFRRKEFARVLNLARGTRETRTMAEITDVPINYLRAWLNAKTDIVPTDEVLIHLATGAMNNICVKDLRDAMGCLPSDHLSILWLMVGFEFKRDNVHKHNSKEKLLDIFSYLNIENKIRLMNFARTLAELDNKDINFGMEDYWYSEYKELMKQEEEFINNNLNRELLKQRDMLRQAKILKGTLDI